MSYKFKHITGHLHVVSKYNRQGFDGEYEGGGTFRFQLKESVYITIAGVQTHFTHIELVLGDMWSDGPNYVKKKSKTKAYITPVPKTLWRDMYESLARAEQGRGQLKDWCFSDEIYDAAFPEKAKKWPR